MVFRPAGIPNPLERRQWYKYNTLYQILLVEHDSNNENKSTLKKTLITKKREDFNNYKLSQETQDNLNLQEYPKAKQQGQNSSEDSAISSYLPSPGVVFRQGFIDALFGEQENMSEQEKKHGRTININNFSDPLRTLLITRKISQLTAKTWHACLEANELNLLEKFRKGSWEDIDSKILDGLIAREIFLSTNKSEIDTFEPPNLDIYYPVISQSEPTDKARFLILPSSTAWQGIQLSLLMAGQVYREVENGKYYHQISQPILSTGEIVTKYSLSVNFESFDGVIKEQKLGRNKASTAYQVEVPYPPIPSKINLSPDDIKDWANDDDAEGKFPFYFKDPETGEYLIDAQYHTPPSSYIPLSCS